MADTVVITSGAASTPPNGTIIATDDAGAAGQVQIVKEAISADGSAVIIPSDATNGKATYSTQAIADNGAFVDGTSKVLPAGFIYDETAGTALTENDAGAARMDAKRAVVGTIEDATTRGQRAGVGANGVLSAGVVAGTGTVTSVADTATSTTLLSASASRKGFIMYNDSDQACYIKYGTTASSTDFTMVIPAGCAWTEEHYNGRVDGIWAANSAGSMRITELTA